MITHTSSWKLVGLALLSFALVNGCGAKQETAASAQTHAFVAQGPAQAAPELEGTALTVCPQLAHEGLAASSYPVDNGFAIVLGSYDPVMRTELQEALRERVQARQEIERAFAQVRATKHDDGHGIYIRFEHEDHHVLQELQEVLQQGIDRRPAAARRVNLRSDEHSVEMQLPAGGPLITARTDAAANDSVAKWTNRQPTEFTYQDTEHGARLEVRSHDQERLDELRKDIVEAIFRCDNT